MKQKIVGTYFAGRMEVQLVFREDTGGEFYLCPEKGKLPRIQVGIKGDDWGEIVAVILHEITELIYTLENCRYKFSQDFSGDHAAYLFSMDHLQFSMCTARVADFLASALPDASAIWSKYNKNKNRKWYD